MNRIDKISGVVLFLAFGGAFLYARSFPPPAAAYVFVVNILGMILSAFLILVSFINDLKKKDKSPLKKISKEAWVRIGITTAATIVYAVLIRFIGYVLSTILFGAGMMVYLYLGQKNKKHYITTLIISVSLALVLYLIFGKLLYIPLP